MRLVQMNAYNMEGNGSAEANQLVGDGKQVVREGVVNGGQRGVSEENKLANDLQMEDVNGVSGMPDQPEVDPQGLHQQRQFIHWERFLHVRTLKVLLVENDDSTRHIVSALLRNCSYEVIAVSNGLQAWKLLEDINNQIDLVLSEVVMPVLSGIGLLSKIMSHKTRKTTPVIMTSSHDAMGVVFKCLSKGAVDFLAKPIRKNELKNLWQHVWRKCHSSSGSGSESGVQNQKSMRSRSGDEESENSGSREEYDDRSIDLLRHDGSDNGSGTQSSWTKKAVDVESPQPMSSWEQLSDPPDSTCAQVIHSRSEAFASSWVPTSAKEHKELKQCENVATDKNIQVGSTGSQKTQNSLHELKKSLVKVTGDDENLAAPDNNEGKIFNSTDMGAGSENRKGDRIRQTADLNGIIISNCDTCKGSSESKLPCSISQSCKTSDEAKEKAKDLPSLELTLTRGVDVDVQPTAPDQNTLRHSELSAFTRYPDGSAEKQTPTGIVGSCSPVENSSDAAKTDSPQNLRSDTPPNQASNGSSNNNDMGSTTYRSFTKPAEIIDKPSAKTTSSAVDCANPSIVQPVKDGLQSVTQNDKIDAGPKHTVLGKSGGVGQEVQVQHHYHHYHHHHHHVHCLPQRNQGQKRDESSPKNMLAAQDCGSSRKVRRGVEVNIPNGSASSNHGSNLHNGSSTAVNGEGTNMVNDNWAAAKGEAGVGCGSGSGSGTGLDQDLSAQREAGLNKICQKRKERFFEKRVRHQNRKKVAEERPRVRGEFVHQVQENKSKDADT